MTKVLLQEGYVHQEEVANQFKEHNCKGKIQNHDVKVQR